MIRTIPLIVLLFSLFTIGLGAPTASAANPGAKSAAAAGASSGVGAKRAKRPGKHRAKTVRKMKEAAQQKLDAAAEQADRDVKEFFAQIDNQRGMAQRIGNRFSLPQTPELAERANELMAAQANSLRAMAVNRRATLREFAAANNIRIIRSRPRRAAPVELDPPAAQSDTLAVPVAEVRPAKSALPPGGQPLGYQSRNPRSNY